MDNALPPRRSFWRFSLRELLLVIGAFLGWGQSLVRRYQDLTPTPMASYFVEGRFGKDVVAALQKVNRLARFWDR